MATPMPPIGGSGSGWCSNTHSRSSAEAGASSGSPDRAMPHLSSGTPARYSSVSRLLPRSLKLTLSCSRPRRSVRRPHNPPAPLAAVETGSCVTLRVTRHGHSRVLRGIQRYSISTPQRSEQQVRLALTRRRSGVRDPQRPPRETRRRPPDGRAITRLGGRIKGLPLKGRPSRKGPCRASQTGSRGSLTRYSLRS